MKKIQTIGIIGFGQFGKLMHTYLAKHFEVKVYDRSNKSGMSSSLEAVCASDVVIFSVPMGGLMSACKDAQKHIAPETIIMDVTSVKVRPLEIITQHFPNNPLLGTHPIFGPQSVIDNNGIEGAPLVLTNVSLSDEDYASVQGFASDVLKLAVIEKTADEHDKEMSMVQGLTHFIGRALNHMNIELCDTGTHSYNQLVKLKDLLQYDSWELFETIQNNNPYICDTRREFIKELETLETKLGNVCA